MIFSYLGTDGNITSGTNSILISVSGTCNFLLTGDNFFSDSNLGENKGTSMTIGYNTRIYLGTNKPCDLNLENKYIISEINCSSKLFALNIENLSYSKNIRTLYARETMTEGDVSFLKKCTLLSVLNLRDTKNVYGDIESISNLTKLTSLDLMNTNVNGDITTFFKLSELSELNLRGTSVYGDLSKLPSKLSFFPMSSDDNNIFSWKSIRPSNSKILALENINLGNDVDNMLINQKDCVVGFSESDEAYKKTIFVKGTRTSASDEAVSILQAKGYTIKITPVEL
uniref:Putative receptor protein kinase TMK1-like kinase, TRANSFERASE n=1 Tax=Podoviridae sp. ctJDl18 TaxID=2825242 RepID=A0A8S5V0I9_9CAUD|nr:MAG TPA: putative receptor protein kinase TMK1-like kinase, TRANSFERASE [Podoviridae sp. ctJDl18]